jgi:hypothetical protein
VTPRLNPELGIEDQIKAFMLENPDAKKDDLDQALAYIASVCQVLGYNRAAEIQTAYESGTNDRKKNLSAQATP